MVYGFDDDKHKVELLKVIEITDAPTSPTRNIEIPYPNGFTPDNTIIHGIGLQIGEESWAWGPSWIHYSEYVANVEVETGEDNITLRYYPYSYSGYTDYTFRVVLGCLG